MPVVGAGSVAKERDKTGGRVVVAGCVASERAITGGRVGAAGGIALESICTECRVVGAGSKAQERIISLGGVEAGIASVRRRVYRLRILHQCKADECEWE